jgi:hypothetical protein
VQIEGLLATLMQEPGLQERVLKCFSSCVRFGTFDDDLLAQRCATGRSLDVNGRLWFVTDSWPVRWRGGPCLDACYRYRLRATHLPARLQVVHLP